MAKTKQDKKPEESPKPADGGWRETVESIAMAVILALLFRGFVAEAFVIPTGSMAPTLFGRHKDVECPKCGVWYQTTASGEVDDGRFGGDANSPSGMHVVGTTCPICRYTQKLDLFSKPNDGSFSGDRIIVAKFAYDFAEPQRWDVIVFKFPGSAVQNYIKRLIGLPGETVRVVGGNIWVGPGEDDLRIARKPPHKLNVLLQLVDDTDHIPQDLVELGWPARWQPWPGGTVAADSWQTIDGGRAFEISPTSQEHWLRYRHLVPGYADWKLIEDEQRLPEDIDQRRGQLITDFYAYNASSAIRQYDGMQDWSLLPDTYNPRNYDPSIPGLGSPPSATDLGQHWVDDLAVEVVAEVQSSEGELSLLLVRGGVQHVCRINLADGTATLSMVDIDGQPIDFVGNDGQTVREPKAKTNVQGTGRYRLRLSNCDHEMLLWVNDSAVDFKAPTTYESEELIDPYYSAEEPGDLSPAGVAARGAAVRLSSLRIYRDKYYIAATNSSEICNDYLSGTDGEHIQEVFRTPELWAESKLFEETNRRMRQFKLEEDQFLPLGDNSPQSYDGRYWIFRTYDGDYVEHQFVERDLLIGKALLIYWPHTWNRPVPYTPNFSRMGPIR